MALSNQELEAKIDALYDLAKRLQMERDQLNEKARRLREKRDKLNSEVRQLLEKANEYRAARDRLNSQIKAYKQKRSQATRAAKITREKLKELGIEPCRLRMVPNLPYLVLECEMPDEPIRISFPLNKLGRRVLREIYWHWLPGIDGGTIKLSHVLDLMLIFAPPRIVYRYRSRIRRRTGLARDPRLRNFIIWRRMKATERFRERASPKGSLALLQPTPSHRDGDVRQDSSGPGRGETHE